MLFDSPLNAERGERSEPSEARTGWVFHTDGRKKQTKGKNIRAQTNVGMVALVAFFALLTRARAKLNKQRNASHARLSCLFFDW